MTLILWKKLLSWLGGAHLLMEEGEFVPLHVTFGDCTLTIEEIMSVPELTDIFHALYEGREVNIFAVTLECP